jgi:hypothetical protein
MTTLKLNRQARRAAKITGAMLDHAVAVPGAANPDHYVHDEAAYLEKMKNPIYSFGAALLDLADEWEKLAEEEDDHYRAHAAYCRYLVNEIDAGRIKLPTTDKGKVVMKTLERRKGVPPIA